MNRQFILSLSVFAAFGTAVWAQSVTRDVSVPVATAVEAVATDSHRRGSARHASFKEVLIEAQTTALQGLTCIERRHGKCVMRSTGATVEVQ